MKHRMKWCELREYKWNEYVTIAVNRNLSNCEKARKKGFRGFNGIRTRGLCVSAAVLYQPELWRPIHWRPANLLKPRNPFFRAFSQLLKLRFTAMVTYSFHLHLLYLPTHTVFFFIWQEPVMSHRSKLTNPLWKQQLRLSFCTWSHCVPWNFSKFVSSHIKPKKNSWPWLHNLFYFLVQTLKCSLNFHRLVDLG